MKESGAVGIACRMIFLASRVKGSIVDILYIFNFDAQFLESALSRFRCSLSSLSAQGARICVSNNSEKCIYSRINDVASPRLVYVHRPYRGQFSRAQAINFGVRTLVQSDYFMISDVDLVYRNNHLAVVERKMQAALHNAARPLRMVFWNYNLQPCYKPAWMNRRFLRRFAITSPRIVSSDYEQLSLFPHNGGGFAHGNGIVHLESFMRLRGYDEEMIGYGPEDDLFNSRIGKFNDVIYDGRNDTASIHLWHPRLRQIQLKKNMRIWKERKKLYDELDNPDWSDVMANKNKSSWGKIK